MVCELFLRQAADLAHAFDGLPEVQAAGIEVGVELVAQRTRVFEVTAPAWLGRHGRSPLTPASGVRSRARTPRRCPHRPPVRADDPPAGSSEEHTSEIQSLMRISYAVFCLKKKKDNEHHHKQQ